MAEAEQHSPAVRFYERVRAEVIENQVADEAEAVIAAVWLHELREMRQGALGQIAAMRVAERVARERLRKAESAGVLGDLARARAVVAAVQAEQESEVDRLRGLIARVEEELETADCAGLERSRRARCDLERLRAAWAGAYGDRSPDRS